MWDAGHRVAGVQRDAEAGIVGRNRLHRVRQNSGQSPDGAEGSRKAMWFSEGIRPLPMRRNPKRRFRPTRAGSHRGGGNEEDGLDLDAVQRAAHSAPAAVQDMGVDHRGRHVLVAQELLHRPDVVAGTGTRSP
jgi:hypothetical protein